MKLSVEGFHSLGIPAVLGCVDSGSEWITVDEIDQYEFCPADEVILNRLMER